MHYVFFRVLLLLLLLSSAVSAQSTARILPMLELNYTAPALIAIPGGDDVIAAVRKGDPSPFAGQLMDPNTAIRWLHYLDQARLRLREDVILERRTCNANMDYYERRIVLEQEARAAIEKDYRDRVLKLEQKNVDLQKSLLDPGLFKSPTFWFLAGVLTSGAIVGVSAYSLHQAQ